MGTDTDGLGDDVLVTRLLQRDAAAFGALYDRHSRMAFGLAYRMLNDPPAAEDVVQEAFLSLWRQAASFQAGKSTFRTWLLSIVHHRAIDRLRRAQNREVSDAALEGAPARPDETIDVEQEVAATIESQQIREALGALPPDQRRAIELAYFGGHSHSEIAKLLGIPVGTVKGRLRIGLQKLRTILDQAGLRSALHDA